VGEEEGGGGEEGWEQHFCCGCWGLFGGGWIWSCGMFVVSVDVCVNGWGDEREGFE
jgi:hypothetical protein